jgi:hypothetical protein
MKTFDHRRIAAGLLSVAGAACSQPASSANQPPASTSSKPTPLVAWLDCVECGDAQLAAVAAQKDTVVPELKNILLNGPPPPRLQAQRAYLDKRWQTLKDYERLHPDQRTPYSEQDYVQLYLQKFVLLNRVRAARALGAIGTPSAKDALAQGQALPGLPNDLSSAIERALAAK